MAMGACNPEPARYRATSHISSARVGVLLMMEVVVRTIAISLLSTHSIAAIQILGAALIFAAGVAEVLSHDPRAALG
jgi:drug/metabolite transporter (DMT)-like permease